jgi:FPC/CPF motif-containing protein YcgG
MGDVDGELMRLLDGEPPSQRAQEIHRDLKSFVVGRHPCAGARAVIHKAGYRFGIYPEIGSPDATESIARDLWTFVEERPRIEAEFATFIAIFDRDESFDELEFEAAVWRQLNSLHEIDQAPYADEVSSDAANPQFGFSFASTPFFIVGLHSGSSRLARRFAWPALVFNAHSQFDALIEQGIYGRFQAVVRGRDLALQGSLNPNLAEFGERSEARQYSGRAVEDDWKCPFRAKPQK